MLLNSHCLTLAEFNVAVTPQFLKLTECMFSYTVLSECPSKWGWVTVAMNTAQSSVKLVNATISIKISLASMLMFMLQFYASNFHKLPTNLNWVTGLG